MTHINRYKILGMLLSAAGMILSFSADQINDKVKTDELMDFVAKEVQKQLASGKNRIAK